MRVTQGMLSQQMVIDIQNNYSRLSTLQNEAATGKKVNTPADNPIAASMIMRYNSELASYQQYQTNATTAGQSLSNTSSTMNQAVQIMQRARDLAVQGASGTVTGSDRQAIASEVNQLYQQLVTVGNSQYNGQYIFAGADTGSAPYPNKNAEQTPTDNGSVLFDVGDGVHIPVNVSGQDFFGAPVASGSNSSTSTNAFALLKNLSTDLTNNNGKDVGNLLSQIDTRLSTMNAAQADIGARTDRVNLLQSRLSQLTTNYQTLLSGVQDANMAKVITDLNSAQAVQQASLQVGAQIIQPSLVQFLK